MDNHNVKKSGCRDNIEISNIPIEDWEKGIMEALDIAFTDILGDLKEETNKIRNDLKKILEKLEEEDNDTKFS